ncbi:hypothetical protein DAPPUDRAFT_346765, partial [Daphnia pulex]
LHGEAGGQGVQAVVGALRGHAGVACQVGVGGQHLDHIAGVFDGGGRREGGSPGEAAVGGGQAAEHGVVGAQVGEVKGCDFFGEGEGDFCGLALLEGGFVQHDALHRGGQGVHRIQVPHGDCACVASQIDTRHPGVDFV